MDDSKTDTEASPRQIQEEFLNRIEDPDRRESAVEFFTEDAVVTRAGERFEGLDGVREYLGAGSERYEYVEKDRQRWIETDEYAISIGTLHGVTSDGESFEGVRYVDICRIEDGLIDRLDIYNDVHAEGLL